MRTELIVGAVIIGLAGAASVTWLIYDVRATRASLQTIAESAEPSPFFAPVAPTVVMAPPASRPVERSPQSQPARTNIADPPTPRRLVPPLPGQTKPLVITESVGREALNLVGVDDKAGAVWLSAINSANLAPDERKNLIEDLNETGFADPRNVTLNDLPLIESRIDIIEQLAPDAIDDANAAAFREAYKDLQNMRTKLIGR